MKTMTKKTTGWLVMAAALMIGMASCSSDDGLAEEPMQQPAENTDAVKKYTMTVTASKGGDDSALARAMAEAGLTGDATTRALSLSSDGKTLNATWAEGEMVTVTSIDLTTYEPVTHGTLTAQSSGETTTLTGELTDINVGDVLFLKFHADYDLTAAQGGTLQYIADNLDYDEATVTVKEIVDGNIILEEATAVFNWKGQSIVRFTLVDKADPTKRLKPSNLTIDAKYAYSWDPSNYFSVKYRLSGLTDATYEANAYGGDNGDGVLYAAINPYDHKDLTFNISMPNGETYFYIRDAASFEKGKFYSITMKMQSTILTGDIDLSTIKHDMTIAGEATLSGSLGGNYKLSIADGATVTLNNATINGTNSESYKWAGLSCQGDATIVLADGSENLVEGFFEKYPGIHVGTGHTLTIQGGTEGTGSLVTVSKGHGAGIGGVQNGNCGNIVIAGGTITAWGGGGAAGIGSGNGGGCDNITISGGTVTSTGGGNAAGIGSGETASCGTITISGTANVTGKGGTSGAGIGSGFRNSSCGTITISGTANVTGKGGMSGAGIGSGYYVSSCDKIIISGGTVNATGGNNAAGIGSGQHYSSCDGGIIITTGVTSVTATHGSGPGGFYCIGSGIDSSCGTITIGCTLDEDCNPVGGDVYYSGVSGNTFTYPPTE